MIDYSMIELFAQDSWHSEGVLRLNRAGAAALIEGLQSFLDSGDRAIEVLASDGEGYSLHLVTGEMHDMLDASHYLDTPGLDADCGTSVLLKLRKGSSDSGDFK